MDIPYFGKENEFFIKILAFAQDYFSLKKIEATLKKLNNYFIDIKNNSI